MVRLGVIGLSTAWEERHRTALERLRHRTGVTAVFDFVPAKAELVADELCVPAVKGLLALARRNDVDALLLLDVGWYGPEAVRLLCAAGKPVYIAADIGRDSATLRALHWTAMSYGLTLMPEFQLRYTPASSRLQELMATKLGRPRHVRVELRDAGVSNGAIPKDAPKLRRRLVDWFDWLRYVTRAVPGTVGIERRPSEPAGYQIAVPFIRETTGEVATTEILLGNEPTDAANRSEIDCERGRAVIDSPTVIHWETDAGPIDETLTADRNETEVMLDHFCRRVVGGLIPVADLADVSQGLELYDALWNDHDG